MKTASYFLGIGLSLLISMAALSQQITYSDLQKGLKPKGEFTSYISKDGAVYNIGDRIKIGVPSAGQTFSFITEGDGFILAITQLTAASSGQETEIKRFSVFGTKRSGFFVSVRSKGITGLSNYSIQLENAIETGEVISFGMTSDEALTALKKAKDKLDLGLITPEEYAAKKAELARYIK
ncbi:MAG: SHOCT domain-containing protein [Bacteroidetes bacterium]|nr:SHOCT domain-containing protein [Bacteroidota bacterium]